MTRGRIDRRPATIAAAPTASANAASTAGTVIRSGIEVLSTPYVCRIATPVSPAYEGYPWGLSAPLICHGLGVTPPSAAADDLPLCHRGCTLRIHHGRGGRKPTWQSLSNWSVRIYSAWCTRRWSLALALALLSACGGNSSAPASGAPAARPVLLSTPAETTLHNDRLSQSIRRGRALVRDTRDSLPRNVGSTLRCVSCHLDDGTRAYAMPWVGVYGRFPQYRSRAGRVARIEDRINDCIQRSLNGTALASDGDDMRDIVAYMSWLSRGTLSGRRLPGSGIDSLAPLAPDTVHGKLAYLEQCARCHGPNGEGLKGATPALSGAPLWGPASFNIGSGMARVRVSAAFVRRNMPFDLPGTISPQTAFDIAGYLEARPRPDFSGKEKDWPNGDAPVDAAYQTTARPPTAPAAAPPPAPKNRAAP